MDINTKPFGLKIIDINNNNCPDCNSKLIKNKTIRKKKIKTCKKCSWSDCGYCKYSDRPFAIGSSTLNNHYPDGCCCKPYPSDLDCECEYKNIDVLIITCNNCRIPKCNDCKVNIINNNYKPLYEHNYISITNTGRLVCNCGEYNRNTPSDDFQNLCSHCNYKLNKGDYNSRFICNECSSKREKYKTIFLETNPDLSDNKNKYKLDETNPYDLKWIHESTTINCFNCNGDIRCSVVKKHLYKYCVRCNPSTRFVEYKWIDNNWKIRLVKILDNKKHKWVKLPNNSNYDENYHCKCDKCKKNQIKINNNKRKIFEKLNLYVNDANTSNDIITELFDIEKSLKVNIKNMKESYGQNYNFNDNIDDNIKTIMRIYRRDVLNEYSTDEDYEYSSDED